MCGEGNENIEHIISSCTTLASREYTDRHNNVAKIIHTELSLKYKCINERIPYYNYVPMNVLENDACKLYWDREILTDRTVQHNRPDICLLDKLKKEIYLIDIAVPAPTNVNRKHQEKIDKYTLLAQDMKEVWGVDRVSVVPIVIGSTGEIPKQLLHNLKKLELNQNLYIQLQKSVILATCNIMRKVLNLRR